MMHIVYRGVQRRGLGNIDGRGVASLKVSFAAQHGGKHTVLYQYSYSYSCHYKAFLPTNLHED